MQLGLLLTANSTVKELWKEFYINNDIEWQIPHNKQVVYEYTAVLFV